MGNFRPLQALIYNFCVGLNVASTSSAESSNGDTSKTETKAIEDEIDVELWKEKWDHGTKSGMNKVDSLRPDPWDQSFLTEKGVKFMSFHRLVTVNVVVQYVTGVFSYMRKLTSGVDKGKFVRLERMVTSKKLDGSNNKRLLSEMPSSITLNRQPYRHVDYVCFQNREIMDRFLERWRMTGQQQAAWLFGSYSKHDDMPLGIRCTVDVIYPMVQEYKNGQLKLKVITDIEVMTGILLVLICSLSCMD